MEGSCRGGAGAVPVGRTGGGPRGVAAAAVVTAAVAAAAAAVGEVGERVAAAATMRGIEVGAATGGAATGSASIQIPKKRHQRVIMVVRQWECIPTA